MYTRLRGPRGLGLIGVVMVGLLMGLSLHASGALSWLELKTLDARFSIRGAQPPPGDVVVVGVDNDSIGHLPRFPFPRRLHARVIDNLHAAGARVIAYDVAFDGSTSGGDDLRLYEAAGRARPVVFGTTLIEASGATNVLGGEANLRAIGARAGAADLPHTSDGVLRRPLAELHHLPSFAASVVAALGKPAARPSLVDRAYIDYPGPTGTIPILPFWRVLANRFDRRAVQGKVVVVGYTAPILHDVHPTSAGGALMSGPEVQAGAISTALRNYPLRDVGGLWTVLIIVLIVSVVPVLDLLFGSVAAAVGAIGALLGWTVAAQVGFDSGAAVDYTSTTMAFLASVAGVFALEAVADSRERRHLRALFAAGAPAVVEGVLNDAEGAAVGPTEIIDGYRLEDQIGRGGMGVVYRATQLALDRRVAVKLITTDNSDDPDFRVRFKRESRLAAAIEHPNVIPVFDAGEDDGLLFIAMRYVDGVDLGNHVRRNGVLPLELAARLTAQIASALSAAHALGLVHRDVKPANVLLTNDKHPHVYLTDFGIAKQLSSETGLTEPGSLVGTVDYMAPEQIRGEAVDHRADIYALAGLFYYSLVGAPPFPRDNDAAKLWAHVSAPPPRPSEARPDLPIELDAVVALGLAKLPADRYGDATQLAAAVVRLARLDVWASSGELVEELESRGPTVDAEADEAGA